MEVNQDCSLHQLEVSNVFLRGDLTNGCSWNSHLDMQFGGSAKVRHLLRVIYDLKKSPHAWFKKFNQHILAQELTACLVDIMVFQKHTFVHTNSIPIQHIIYVHVLHFN